MSVAGSSIATSPTSASSTSTEIITDHAAQNPGKVLLAAQFSREVTLQVLSAQSGQRRASMSVCGRSVLGRLIAEAAAGLLAGGARELDVAR